MSERIIMIVDDEPLNLKLLSALVKKIGYESITAESGEQCVELIENGPVDLILMDHLMPGMDGVETLNKLREMKVNNSDMVPVVALTASAGDEAYDEYISLGFNDYIAKPVKKDLLEAVVTKYI